MSHSTLRVDARRLLAGAAMLLAAAAGAATLTVPGSSPTIQGAIGMAASGDTILVSPGTYTESINFLGKNVTLRSTGGASVTTITPPGMTSVVLFVSGETRSAALDGFTLTGGRPNSASIFDGGGIFIQFASPTIVNNVITGNIACRGGGIEVFLGSPVIGSNLISANRADCSQAGGSGVFWGGGISLDGGGGFADISGNTIVGNIAGTGGAIGMVGAGAPRITLNVITGNTSTEVDCSISGGAVWVESTAAADFVQNVIASNAGPCTGGISFRIPPSVAAGVTLVNNTIALNTGSIASGVLAKGFFGGTKTRLVNNVIQATPGATALACSPEGSAGPPSPVMRNNVIWSSGGVAATNACAGQIGVNGNVSADPRLIAPASGDYRLQPASPAIDTGDGSDALLPTTDLAGAPRVQDGNGDGSAVVDAGAFEAPPPVRIATPVPASRPLSLALLSIVLAMFVIRRRPS